MSEEIYRKLREQLDQYSVGFPATKSGVELEILRKLFTPEEADLYLYLTMVLETPDAIAGRTGRDLAQTAALLDRMYQGGLIFRLKRGEAVKYAASPFVVGSFEFQLKTLDKELAELIERYAKEGFLGNLGQTGAIMRPIPVNRSVDTSTAVAPYNDARKILEQQKLIAVAECICRKLQGMLEKGCDKPREACFVFGAHGEYYIGKGMGRQVNIDEALAILDRSEKAGLVVQPYNTVNPGGMCNCCGDCCGILRAVKKLPRPVEAVVSTYRAKVDEDACVGCEICLERCQMDAITMSDDSKAQINPDRCIGCGLCVTTCAVEAMSLVEKPEGERKAPPANGYEQMTQMAERRGTSLTPLALKG